MIYTYEQLFEMLSRVGGTYHEVDGEQLFCRFRAEARDPDEYGRVLGESARLVHIEGDTRERSARQQVTVDGQRWQIVHVLHKTSGVVVWTLARYTG